MICTLVACAGYLLTTPPAAATEEDAAYAAVVEANEAFSAGRFEEALVGYESAGRTLGESPELNYNRAAAHYKLQQYQPAANLLAKAALSTDPGLSRRARFNWGNCDYASAMAELAAVIPQEASGATGAPPEAGRQPDLQAASAKLQSAIRHYRGIVDASNGFAPDQTTDRAARENIERAQRLIDRLEELEQEQEQQQQQQDQKQDEDQQDKQDQEDQQQQQDKQDEQQNEDEQQQQDQPPKPDQQEQDQSQENQDQQPQPQPDQQQERKMTPEQAEAMLQSVRDKEKQRREEKQQRARKQRVPVVKDW